MRVNKANVSGPVAQVHGIEPSHRRSKSGEAVAVRIMERNIFVHRNDRWLLVFYQAVAMLQNVLPPNLKDEWLVS